MWQRFRSISCRGPGRPHARSQRGRDQCRGQIVAAGMIIACESRADTRLRRRHMRKTALALMATIGITAAFGSCANAQSVLEKIKRDGAIKVCMPQIVPD